MLVILDFIKNSKSEPTLIFSSTKTIENDILAKNMGPYSISKRACEELIGFYSRYYKVKFHIIRFNEVFSIKNNPKNKALVKLLHKSENNEKIFIDNKNHNFEYFNLEVICEGIVKILKEKIKYQFINFYGEKINILQLVTKINKILNSNSKIVIKKQTNKKSLVINNKTLYHKVSEKNKFFSNLHLIIKNEFKTK